jgi:mRNA interferase RelE/StbE
VTYRVILKPSAVKDIDRLPAAMQRRILARLEQIASDPKGPGSVKLVGAPAAYRVRVGDWRIVYQTEDQQHIVFVTIVAHRREVYRKR